MIRIFQSSDLSRVMEIWLRSNMQAHPFIPHSYWETHFDEVSKALAQASVFVYESGGGIQGFIGLTGDYIAGIFVDDAARGNGIGRMLLDHAKGRHTRLTLQVYEKNRRAAAFYQREQFIIQARQLDESTGEMELLMAWTEKIRGALQNG